KGRDARKRAYCLKIQPATGSFARNLIYSTKPFLLYRKYNVSIAFQCWSVEFARFSASYFLKPTDDENVDYRLRESTRKARISAQSYSFY
ncbi:hypothetical protein, partial [Klebsiella pneumoniae]|uniref:hypothetical protein n=1 Tax=Klebsiella pneumoniae TaxID=573 RepID=UPI00254AEC16